LKFKPFEFQMTLLHVSGLKMTSYPSRPQMGLMVRESSALRSIRVVVCQIPMPLQVEIGLIDLDPID